MATSEFLAVVTVALLGVFGVAHWISSRRQEREMKERFALLQVWLEHPDEEGARVIAAWREHEALARARERRQRLRGGIVAVSAGVAVGTMLRVLAPGSGAWAIGLVPGLVGCAIAVLAYLDRGAGVESRA